MTSKVIRSTSKGQITLPKKWRSLFGTDNYIVEMHEDQLVVKPLAIDLDEDEEVIFDAERDNKGKGIAIDDMISLLKKVKNG